MYEMNEENMTSLVKINMENTPLYLKLEGENVGGSIKDRVARFILDEAVKEGKLKKGGLVVEATSGNTGIGLALFCKERGYRCVIVMPDSMTKERRELIASYGGEVLLTDGILGMQGSVEKALTLCKEEGGFFADQFNNMAGVRAHYAETAPELWKQMNGDVDILVAGVGTGGTITGMGKYLKEKNPKIQVIAVEPKSSPLLSEGWSAPHKIQGIGANFVPGILDTRVYDEVVAVADEDAIAMTGRLYKEQNLYVGISSGAVVCAGLEIGKRPGNKDKKIAVICPDEGGRYACTGIFDV